MKFAISLLMLIIAGCGSSPMTPVQSQSPIYFPLAIGQHWQMINTANAAITSFEVLSVGDHWGCETGELFDLHVTKSAPDTYWGPGNPGAELHFILKKDGPDDFHSVGWSSQSLTVQYHTPASYTILGSNSVKSYRRQVAHSVVSDCIPGDDGIDYPWTSTFTVEHGVMHGHYEEGDSSDRPAQQVEDWYFTPGVGLSKIVDFRQSGIDFNPPIVIERH